VSETAKKSLPARAVSAAVSRTATALCAAAAFCGLGVAGVHAGVGPFVPARDIEANLEAAAASALLRRTEPWASVTMSGRRARIEGEAPSPVAVERALRAVKRSSGGRLRYGVASVSVDAVVIADAALRSNDPLRLLARKSGAAVEFAGVFNDPRALAAAREALSRRGVAARFDAVETRARPPSAAVAETAVLASRALMFLDDGGWLIDGDALVLRGIAGSADAAASTRAMLASISDQVERDVRIVVVKASFEAEIEPCARLFDARAAELRGAFAEGVAAFSSSAPVLLDAFAHVAARCAPFAVALFVEPPSADAAGARVAAARAEALRGALAERGLAAPRATVEAGGSARPASYGAAGPAGRVAVRIAPAGRTGGEAAP